MKNYSIKKQFFLSGLFVFMILVQVSLATTIEQMFVHSKAISLGNAVTAYPPGLMSIHYNPAGLSQVREGIVFSQGFTLAHHNTSHRFKPDPDFPIIVPGKTYASTDDPVANTESNSEDHRLYIPFYGKGDFPVLMMPLPFGISSRQFGSRWTFAYAVYSPYNWGEETEDYGGANYQKKAAYLQHFIYAAPAASYQISDHFSVGVSLGLGQSAMGILSDIRLPNDELFSYTNENPFQPFAEMEFSMRSKNEMAPSVNVGILWEPLSWLAFGCVYQSQIQSDLEGRFHIDYLDAFQKLNPNVINQLNLSNKTAESGIVTMDNFSFPERLQFGIKLRPFKKLRLMCDFHWANWADNYELKFQTDNQSPIALFKLARQLGSDLANDNTLIYQKELNPTWHLSFGLEYQIKECLALRLGYENRKSNTDDEYFDLLTMPDIDYYGAGLGLKLKQGVELDLGLGYMVNSGTEITNGMSQNLNQFQTPIYSPFAGQHCETIFEAYFLSVNLTMPFETMYQKLDQVF